MRRSLLLFGFSLLLAGCQNFARERGIRFPWERVASSAGASSSIATLDLLSEPSFADEVIPTETGSDILEPEPQALSGALMERLSDEFLEIGLATAPSLTVFTHPSCTYCTEFERDQLPRLLNDFVAHGKLKLRFVIVPFQKYPASTLQTRILTCAAAEGRGRETLTALHENPSMTEKSFPAFRKALAFSPAFDSCMATPESPAHAALIAAKGVTLVPTFDWGGTLKTGLQNYADLRGWIEAGR